MSPIRSLTAVAVAIALAAAVFDSATPVLARQQPSPNRPEARAPAYSYAREAALAAKFDLDNPDPAELRRTFDERRARVLAAIPEGALLVFSAEQPQPRRLEFQVPHSENHDFIYLTGIEGLDSLDSALLLLPTPEKNWVVLYTSAAPETIKSVTGIEEVRALSRLEEDLSAALTDYRDWRITQRRRYPLPGALAKAWGRKSKALYLNYPRFLRVGMQEPPRLELFSRLQRFSPELDVRDSADVIDPIRMLHDAYSLASIRRAVTDHRRGRRRRPARRESRCHRDAAHGGDGLRLPLPRGVSRIPHRRPEESSPEAGDRGSNSASFRKASSSSCHVRRPRRSKRPTWSTSTLAPLSTITRRTSSATRRWPRNSRRNSAGSTRSHSTSRRP